MEDDALSSKASTSVCKEKIHDVLVVIEEDHRMTTEANANTLEISASSAYTILSEELELRKLHTPLVPRSAANNPAAFLHRIITGDGI